MIVFEKFGQHQPLNRQAERYALEGVPIVLSTMADAVGSVCAALDPLLRLVEAHDLGENEDWLRDVAFEMETEDGVIWIRGLGEDGVMALTDFGIENLIELIKIYKEDPTLLRR